LSQAWQLLGEASTEGPLTEREMRLVKLGVALGAMREGAVHSNVRKAIAQEVSREEIEQVVAIAAGTIGMPATVAVYTWVQDCFGRSDENASDTPSPEKGEGR
jgi:4-carboxymuconolactone decarboxylase